MNEFLFYPDYAKLLVVEIAVFLLLSVGVIAWLTFNDTPRGQALIKDRLGRKLAGTRMWSMLEHRDVPPLQYLDQCPVDELRSSIRTCGQCSKHEQCDEVLGYRGAHKRNYGFCPNRRSIDRVARAVGVEVLH